jgi:AcrR family transcriptional regulator
MAEKKNRNALRSIRLIKEAFLELLATEPYEKITVTDVTREAGLNRGTFYAHFDDMDDLLHQVIEEVVERASELLQQSFDTDFLENPLPILEQLGKYMSESYGLYGRVLNSASSDIFVKSLGTMFEKKVHGWIDAQNVDDPTTQLMLSDYLVGGVLHTYRAWMDGEYGNIPIEEVNLRLGAFVKAAGRIIPQRTRQ